MIIFIIAAIIVTCLIVARLYFTNLKVKWWFQKHWTKIFAVFTAGGLIAGGFGLFPTPSWWDTDWSYYKVCHIDNANNGYQMKLVVGQGSGDGGDVHCENHCQNNFGDIRFIDTDETPVLDYWMQNYTDGVQATFWIETPSDVTSDNEILMYYGTALSSSTTSNGANTFIDFDHCTTLTGWDTDYGSPAQSGSEITLNKGGGGIMDCISESISGLGTHFRYHVKMKYDTSSSSGRWGLGRSDMTPNEGGWSGPYIGLNAGDIQRYHSSNGWITIGTYSDNVYFILDLMVNDTTNKFLSSVDGASSTGWWGFRNSITIDDKGGYEDSTSYNLVIDWMFCSKYVASEPNFSTFGAEQSQGGGWTNSPPINSAPVPVNKASDIPVSTSQLNITVSDVDDANQSMSINWRTNASGVWQTMQTNNTVSNGTYYCLNTTWLSNYSKIYYWSVNTSDSNSTPAWDNDTYLFTTEAIATSVDAISPYTQTSSPLTITATGNSDLGNVTLYYRYSTDNSTWNSSNRDLGWELANHTVDGGPVSSYLDYSNTAVVKWHNSSTICAYIAVYGFGGADAGLLILNVTDQTHPVELDWISSNDAHDIAILDYAAYGRIAFITDYFDGSLTSYNVTKPWDISAAMDEVDDSTAGMYMDIDEENFILYLTDKSDQLHAYNITNPSSITLFDTITTGLHQPWYPHVNTQDSDYVYVSSFETSELGGISIYNVTNVKTTGMTFITNNTPNRYAEVDQLDNYIYAASAAPIVGPTRCLKIMDATDPTNLTNVSQTQLDTASHLFPFELDSYKYCFGRHYDGVGNSGIVIMDINDSSNPSKLGAIPSTAAQLLACAHWMQLAYNNITDAYVLYAISYLDDNWVMFNISRNTSQGGWIEWDNVNNPDTAHPWSWNFDFPNGTGYYEFYSIGNKAGSIIETAPSTCDAMCNYSSTTQKNTTIRSNGIDYFVWLGGNTSAYHVAAAMNASVTISWGSGEHISIWNTSGTWGGAWYKDGPDSIWYEYHPHNGTGNNWSINTFDVVRVYITDNTGNMLINMSVNDDMTYDIARNASLTNTSANKGGNFVGYCYTATIALKDAVDSQSNLTASESVTLWNESTFAFDTFYIKGFGGATADILDQYEVVFFKVSDARYWAQE